MHDAKAAFPARGFGNFPVHLGNVAGMDVCDLGVASQVVADLVEHPLFVAMGTRRLLRQVLGDVAIDQLLDAGSLAPLALLARRIAAHVHLAPQLLGAGACGADAPGRKRSDGVSSVAAVEAVVQEEALARLVAAGAETGDHGVPRGLAFGKPFHDIGVQWLFFAQGFLLSVSQTSVTSMRTNDHQYTPKSVGVHQ